MIAAALAVFAAAVTPASAAPAAEPQHGRTLPPIGFVAFCKRVPEACLPRGVAGARPTLSARQWDMVARINSYVNAAVAPASDEEVYGEPEYWSYPGTAGDCEDYVLLKQRYLEGLGLPRSALLITVVLDSHNEGHAVLTLATSEGDMILDNRRGDIRRWGDTDYHFLKRQSQADPRDWVSLSPGETAPARTVSLRGAGD